jgi:hypothetical protein
MKKVIVSTILALVAGITSAEAEGCIKGAVVVGVAGHAAHQGVLGAIAGCATGRRAAKKRAQQNQQSQQNPQSQPEPLTISVLIVAREPASKHGDRNGDRTHLECDVLFLCDVSPHKHGRSVGPGVLLFPEDVLRSPEIPVAGVHGAIHGPLLTSLRASCAPLRRIEPGGLFLLRHIFLREFRGKLRAHAGHRGSRAWPIA